MKVRTPLRVAFAMLALAAAHGFAAPPVVLPDLHDTYIPQAPSNDALYRDLGGETGVKNLVETFQKRLLADPRLEPFFRDVDLPELRKQLAVQFCEVSGGPCKVAKRNMKKIHSGMDINKGNFNALVEVLQQAMDAQGITFSAQNRLLAQLAPMHRDIINVK